MIVYGTAQVARGCSLFGARGRADRSKVIQKLDHPLLSGPIFRQVGAEPIERRAQFLHLPCDMNGVERMSLQASSEAFQRPIFCLIGTAGTLEVAATELIRRL